MYTEQSRHSYQQSSTGRSGGPEVLYGYCHQTRRMRMMSYPDYMSNMQTGISNLYQGSTTMMQPMIDTLTNVMGGAQAQGHPGHSGGCHEHHECGCHEHHHHHHGHHEHDCSCQCCIRCADVVEYARCGEVRQIPITFDNDTRRERNVKLQLGAFATESGQDPGWQATLSETEFTLPPCGEKTVFLSVPVDCAKLAPPRGDERKPTTVDSCKVLYATLRAEGCTIRPLVIAVAVVPQHCGAHRAGCGCGCCCN